MALPDHRVALVRSSEPRYPRTPPFHPDTRFPEAPFPETASETNPAYAAVRNLFRAYGLDAARFGTAAWNPLGDVVREGDTVLLKPNLVKESHPRDPDGWRYTLTHGSVIRAVADYVARAIGRTGRIWLADSPQTDSSWKGIVSVLDLDSIVAFYASKGIAFELVDLRQQEWSHRDGVVFERRSLPGDPRGYVAFDLGRNSEFHGHRSEGRYYGADYVQEVVNVHHAGDTHEYLISGSAIRADVFINLPKMKTHKKAGITCSLKNLVGINGDKNWLPHHSEGDPSSGGDEVPRMAPMHRLERAAVRALRKGSMWFPYVGPRVFHRAKQVGKVTFGDTESVVRSGNWYGNDTTWRMCLDLNKLLLYGNRDGSLREPLPENRKRYLSIVDGIVAGEGRGPMNPDPVESGVLLMGCDPVAVDVTCATLMGFEIERLPIVREAFRARGWPLTTIARSDIAVASDAPEWNGPLAELDPARMFRFRPHFGWEGHVEMGSGARRA